MASEAREWLGGAIRLLFLRTAKQSRGGSNGSCTTTLIFSGWHRGSDHRLFLGSARHLVSVDHDFPNIHYSPIHASGMGRNLEFGKSDWRHLPDTQGILHGGYLETHAVAVDMVAVACANAARHWQAGDFCCMSSCGALKFGFWAVQATSGRRAAPSVSDIEDRRPRAALLPF
jgi:hypothetical protein